MGTHTGWVEVGWNSSMGTHYTMRQVEVGWNSSITESPLTVLRQVVHNVISNSLHSYKGYQEVF